MSSALSHIFRQPFAAGQVFSASMLNSLLYQVRELMENLISLTAFCVTLDDLTIQSIYMYCNYKTCSWLLQTFVKGYLITLVRLLLGIDAEENSGHLSSVRFLTYCSQMKYLGEQLR